VKLCRLP